MLHLFDQKYSEKHNIGNHKELFSIKISFQMYFFPVIITASHYSTFCCHMILQKSS